MLHCVKSKYRHRFYTCLACTFLCVVHYIQTFNKTKGDNVKKIMRKINPSNIVVANLCLFQVENRHDSFCFIFHIQSVIF